MALACDILLGDVTTTFRDTHVKFGLAPCWGLSQRLTQRIGPGRARLVSLAAMPVNAHVAYEWGLLDELIPRDAPAAGAGVRVGGVINDDPVLDRAIELARAISTNDPLMVRRYKRAMIEGGGVDHGRGIRRERELGLAHYVEIVGDGRTFEGARGYITDVNRPRASSSKL